MGPGKNRKTEIYCSGVECINCIVEFDSYFVVHIEFACNLDKRMSKVGINSPIAKVVGIEQSIAGDATTDANMVKLVLLFLESDLYVTTAFSIGKLRK
jgi:hypothetical protein